jgi:hypothetical protein
LVFSAYIALMQATAMPWIPKLAIWASCSALIALALLDSEVRRLLASRLSEPRA